MAYEASTELARRRRDLAVAREKAMSEFNQAQIGRRYGISGRQQEAGFESRGILRSGEAMRGRVDLGAAEKAERAAELMRSQGALDTAELDYAEVLAKALAAGGAGGGGTSAGVGTPATSPAPQTQVPPLTPNIPPATTTGATIAPRPVERVNPATVGGSPADWAKAMQANPVLARRPGTTSFAAPKPAAPTPPRSPIRYR